MSAVILFAGIGTLVIAHGYLWLSRPFLVEESILGGGFFVRMRLGPYPLVNATWSGIYYTDRSSAECMARQLINMTREEAREIFLDRISGVA